MQISMNSKFWIASEQFFLTVNKSAKVFKIRFERLVFFFKVTLINNFLDKIILVCSFNAIFSLEKILLMLSMILYIFIHSKLIHYWNLNYWNIII